MRVGLFGGSFDPVHYAHLLLAECCREQCRLDRVVFLPAAVSPHKQGRALTSPEHRVAMLELAIAGEAGFAVGREEIQRGGISYTVETLRRWRAENPSDELFLLMGADVLNDLPTWREAASVCQLAMPVVVHRAGAPPPDFERLAPLAPPGRLRSIRSHQVEMPPIGISSSELRSRVAQGLSIRYRTPRAVEQYILTNGLYRSPDQAALRR